MVGGGSVVKDEFLSTGDRVPGYLHENLKNLKFFPEVALPRFDEWIELIGKIGADKVELVLDVVGGPAGATRYVPSAEAFRRHVEESRRNAQIKSRFEIVMREESQNGKGFTTRAYEVVGKEFCLSARHICRVVNDRG